MSAFVPASLRRSSNSAATVDAVYYVVRVLRNSLRGYASTPVSSEPSFEARVLAQSAVREIEKAEGHPIPMLDGDIVTAYIATLEEFLTESYRKADDVKPEDAADILNSLRSERL
jgi:hypothetical protein